MRFLDVAEQLVRFLVAHLAAAHHVLHEVARALDRKPGHAGRGVDDVLHRAGNLAVGFEAELLRLLRHLGDSIANIGPAMAGPASRRGGNDGAGHGTG